MEYNAAIEAMHTICNTFAPNARAQRGFVQVRREAERAYHLPSSIVAQMAMRLLDGIPIRQLARAPRLRPHHSAPVNNNKTRARHGAILHRRWRT